MARHPFPRLMTIGGAATCPDIFSVGFWGPSCWCSRAKPSATPRRLRAKPRRTEAKAAARKEHDRLWGETQKLRAAGKTAEAIAAAEAMLAIEREVSREVITRWSPSSLGWLAETPRRARGLRGGESGPARGPGHPAEATGRVRLAGRRCPPGAGRRRAPGRDGPGPARTVWPRRTGSTEGSRTCTEPASTPKPCLWHRPWRSARRCRASTPSRHQPEQPGGLLEARGTTPPPSPSTSRPWRSARRPG